MLLPLLQYIFSLLLLLFLDEHLCLLASLVLTLFKACDEVNAFGTVKHYHLLFFLLPKLMLAMTYSTLEASTTLKTTSTPTATTATASLALASSIRTRLPLWRHERRRATRLGFIASDRIESLLVRVFKELLCHI